MLKRFRKIITNGLPGFENDCFFFSDKTILFKTEIACCTKRY